MTLIEVIVVLAIFSLTAVALTNSVLFFYKTNAATLEQAAQVREAGRGMERMIHELREASYGDEGSYPVASFASSSVTFYADVDQDGETERVRYELWGTSMRRGVLSPSGNPLDYAGAAATTTIAEYVRNFSENTPVFRYWDAAGAEITDAADIGSIVSVSVNLIIDVTLSKDPAKFSLRSSATLRNVRSY